MATGYAQETTAFDMGLKILQLNSFLAAILRIGALHLQLIDHVSDHRHNWVQVISE